MGFLNKIFRRNKKVEQKTEKVELMNPNDIWFTIPTISNEFPQTVDMKEQTEFDIFIHEDLYRTNEFLNFNALPLIEQEFVGIKEIWANHSEKSDDYVLFKKCHVREIVAVHADSVQVRCQVVKIVYREFSRCGRFG